MRRLSTRFPGAASASRSGSCRSPRCCSLYVLASQWRLADNPDDKLLPSLACDRRGDPAVTRSRKTCAAAGCCSGWTPGRACDASALRCWSVRRSASWLAIAIGVVPRLRALLVAAAVDRRDDSAARRAADPVHRARTRRDLEDRADRDRHCAVHRPRPGAARRRAAVRAARSRRRRSAPRPGS